MDFSRDQSLMKVKKPGLQQIKTWRIIPRYGQSWVSPNWITGENIGAKMSLLYGYRMYKFGELT